MCQKPKAHGQKPTAICSQIFAHGHLPTDICPWPFAHGYLPTDICPRIFAHGYLPTDICPRTFAHQIHFPTTKCPRPNAHIWYSAYNVLWAFVPWAFFCGQMVVSFWPWAFAWWATQPESKNSCHEGPDWVRLWLFKVVTLLLFHEKNILYYYLLHE